VTAGAEVEAATNGGNTTLIEAAESGYYDIVKRM
jgi:hypothetical protein